MFHLKQFDSVLQMEQAVKEMGVVSEILLSDVVSNLVARLFGISQGASYFNTSSTRVEVDS